MCRCELAAASSSSSSVFGRGSAGLELPPTLACLGSSSSYCTEYSPILYLYVLDTMGLRAIRIRRRGRGHSIPRETAGEVGHVGRLGTGTTGATTMAGRSTRTNPSDHVDATDREGNCYLINMHPMPVLEHQEPARARALSLPCLLLLLFSSSSFLACCCCSPPPPLPPPSHRHRRPPALSSSHLVPLCFLDLARHGTEES